MEISSSKSAAFGFFCLSLQLLTLECVFSTGEIREGQLWQLSFAANGSGFPGGSELLPCEGNASVSEQVQFTFHAVRRLFFLSLDLQ